MQEKNWSEVTRLPEEDIALVTPISFPRGMDRRKLWILMGMSGIILAVYLIVNCCIFPAYPVVAPFAERNTAFTAHYPPFRVTEWSNYSRTEDFLRGTSSTAKHAIHVPAGFPLASVPLTLIWGKAGPYFTNVFLLWFSALLFFAVLVEIVSFPVAAGATLFLAFATPNLFYAASAFAEPLGQFLAILVLFLSLRGNAAHRGWPWHLGAGAAAGIILFVQPALALIAVPLLAALVLDGSGSPWRDRNVIALGAGFLPPFVLWLLIAESGIGAVPTFLFTLPAAMPDILLGVWRTIAASPHSLIALVPAVILVPAGMLALWRGGHTLAALVTGVTTAAVIFAAVAEGLPVEGDGLGVRQLTGVMPFLVLPLAYLWEEGGGERIWLGVFGALALYISISGLSGGQRGIPGEMQDRGAQAIILSRKGMLDTDRGTAPELVSRFARALRDEDIGSWLATLSPRSRMEITGIERGVFEGFSRRVRSRDGNIGIFIASVDSSGIRIVIPDIDGEDIPDLGRPQVK